MDTSRKKVMVEKTLSFKERVGKKIKEEREQFFKHCSTQKKEEILSKRKRNRSYEGLSRNEFANELSIDEDQVYNLETGRGQLKLEYLYKISEICNCDIGYLLGECDNRTYVATDICGRTGLSEEAVSVLVNYNKRAKTKKIGNEDVFKELYSEEELERLRTSSVEEIRTFMEVVSRIIESRDLDYSEDYLDFIEENSLSYVLGNIMFNRKSIGYFPINQLVEYVIKTRKANKYKNHKAYSDCIKAFRMFPNFPLTWDLKDNDSFFSQEVCDYLKKRGYTENEIEKAKVNFKGYTFDDYNFETEKKRYLRIDIQDSFLEFLKSGFVEGDNNGKQD